MGPPFLQVQGACEETARPRGRVIEESRNVALVVLHVLELFSLIYVLFKSENIVILVTIGYIVGFIVGMHIEDCLWAQVAVLDIYWTILHCLGQDMQVLDKFCIWIELPVQRRLCPIFVKNVGSPDIHEYSVG